MLSCTEPARLNTEQNTEIVIRIYDVLLVCCLHAVTLHANGAQSCVRSLVMPPSRGTVHNQGTEALCNVGTSMYKVNNAYRDKNAQHVHKLDYKELVPSKIKCSGLLAT